jgi:heme oxygenase
MHPVSLQRPQAASSGADLMSMLRVQTRTHHEALERSLALLEPPLSRDRFLRVLQRFFSFHKVWEPAIATHESLRAFHISRHRLPLLRRDLLAMGMPARDIDTLPPCEDARTLAAHEAEAIGSLYVMEGSTLGGQIISRALAQEAWAPPGGLAFFNPYGDDTGRMWRAFKAFAEQMATTRDKDRIIAGAQRTFDLLNRQLAS